MSSRAFQQEWLVVRAFGVSISIICIITSIAALVRLCGRRFARKRRRGVDVLANRIVGLVEKVVREGAGRGLLTSGRTLIEEKTDMPTD